MTELIILLLFFGSLGIIFLELAPLVSGKVRTIQEKHLAHTEKQLDTMFIFVQRRKLLLMFTLVPLTLAMLGFAISGNPIGFLAGVLVGLVVPLLGLRVMAMQRRAKLESQLVDAVMILSSSLKGGLSLVQSIEVLVEEMGAPISQEFGVILRENKMGITLEESLTRLHERLKIEELTYLVGSLLVARETGGDLTKVLSRLATTIRDNRRLKDSIKTLTLQGKLQGIIMSALPFFFVAWVLSFNKGHFDIMFSTEIGRMLLIAALFLQIIGMFLIKIFSTIRI